MSTNFGFDSLTFSTSPDEHQSEIRQHQKRAALLNGHEADHLQELSAKLKADPSTRDTLSPTQRIALGLYSEALASAEWLEGIGLNDPRGDAA